MSKIIVVDSCAELTTEMKSKTKIGIAPFFIDLNGEHFLADDNVNIEKFLDDMKASKEVVRTAAPTPESYFEAAKGHDEIYFVTISGKLSGSLNSANIAKAMIEEENPNVKAHVFDSKSAACGETLVVEEIQELIAENKSFEEIVETVERKIKNTQTIFVLEDLDNLVKNGRMSKVAGFVASALSIFPVCIANDGEIEVSSKPRGMKNALNKLVQTIGELADDFNERILYITHIKDLKRAETIKEKVLEIYNFKEIKILEGTSLSSTYANRSGIILAY